MMQHVDDNEAIEFAVRQFCSKYSQTELQNAIDGFEWRDTTEASLAKRQEIQKKIASGQVKVQPLIAGNYGH